MVKQEITTAGLTTSEDGSMKGGLRDSVRREGANKRISEALRKAKKRREDINISDRLTELILLRGARPQDTTELLDSSDGEDKKNKKSIDFARELLRKGLISEDTTSWRFLVLHYHNNKRNFPASFFDMLRLEVFYKGIKEARKGDLTLINLYRNAGYVIDSAGFDTSLADEEDYVAGLIDEKPAGTNEDGYGFYKEDIDGRWREPVASGDSGMITDSSMQSISREISRNFQPQKVR